MTSETENSHARSPTCEATTEGRAGLPGSVAATATVHHLPRRRTYLDACRDQGIFQRDEETRSEIFEVRSDITAKEAEKRLQTGKMDGPRSLATDDDHAEMTPMDRVKSACEVYRLHRPDDKMFAFFARLLSSPLSSDQIASCLNAHDQDIQRAAKITAEIHDESRLNSEGLLPTIGIQASGADE